jgi:hypothetical protein
MIMKMDPEPWRRQPGARRKRAATLVTVAVLTVAPFGGCGPDRAWMSGMAVSITPSVILLAPAGANSSSLPTQQSVTVYGQASDGKPAEGTHVDVCVGAGPCGLRDATAGAAADGTGDYVQADGYTQYVQLIANPTADPNAPCYQVSIAQVHCVLTTAGTAQFTVASSNRIDYLGAIPLTPQSGPQPSAPSLIYVGIPIPPNSVLQIPDSITLSPSAAPIGCGDSTITCDDSRLKRKQNVGRRVRKWRGV